MQVYGDPASNSLIVSASREDHQLVENLLSMLDVPNQLSQQVRIFPLEKAQAGYRRPDPPVALPDARRRPAAGRVAGQGG